MAELARSMLTGRQAERVLTMLEAAVPTFADLAPDPAFVGLEAQHARAAFLRDEHHRSLEIAERVLEASERRDLRAILADALVTKGSGLAPNRPIREGTGAIGAWQPL